MPVPLQPLPEPWKLKQTFGVGGLLGVGYAPDSDLLLVCSSAGRSVFDCLTGERVAREEEADGYGNIHPSKLTAKGIGPLADQTLRVAGIDGGGLPLSSGNGIWFLQVEPALYSGSSDFYKGKPCWRVTLLDNRSWQNGRHLRTATLYEYLDFRSTGFSETGKSFVIATSSDLHIFSLE